MTQAELVKNITEEVKKTNEFVVTRDETQTYLKCIQVAVLNAIADGEDVILPGLVKFYLADIPAREHYSVHTKKKELIPAHQIVKAKILGKLKAVPSEG